MKITISVTRQDIRQGVSELGACPIALALSRALPGSRPAVDSESVALWFGPRGHLCKLPIRATRFVWAFDAETRRWLRWLKVRPFSFDLDVPAELAVAR